MEKKIISVKSPLQRRVRLWRKMSNVRDQRGQVLVIMILALLVVSLVVLAVASRSITDIKISQTSEESSRAFSAAEAGVEKAVAQIRTSGPGAIGGPFSETLSSGAQDTYTIADWGNYTPAFLASTQNNADKDVFQAYLANYTSIIAGTYTNGNYTGTSLCIYWGNQGTVAGSSDTPAIEATVLYNSAGLALQRIAIDPNSPTRAGFIAANNDASCVKAITAANNNLNVDRTFAFAHRIDLYGASPGMAIPAGSNLLVLRARLLYNANTPHYVGISTPAGSGLSLPSQGYKIASTGTVGQTTRKVQVFQSYPALPSIFDFVIFNGLGTLTK